MKKNLPYWIVTVIFSFAMGFGGVADILLLEQVRGAVDVLGYPEYFVKILGVAKILGIIVVLLPFPARLKEWAYAGFTINLSMAIISHIVVGDPVSEIIKPAIPLILMFISYFLYHKSLKKRY